MYVIDSNLFRQKRSPERRRQQLDFLLSLSPLPDIFLLQEHHLTPPAQAELNAAWLGTAHLTKHCATLIPNSSVLADFAISHSSSDDGRLLTVFAQSTHFSACITNIYAPVYATERVTFFANLILPTATVPDRKLPTGPIARVIGGDFDDCPNPVVD
jgi:hypothetical protein